MEEIRTTLNASAAVVTMGTVRPASHAIAFTKMPTVPQGALWMRKHAGATKDITEKALRCALCAGHALHMLRHPSDAKA